MLHARICSDSTTYRILNGKCNINGDLFFDINNDDLRGQETNCLNKRFRFNVRKFVFSNRVIDYNSLPADCVNCNSNNTFKKHVSVALGAPQN